MKYALSNEDRIEATPKSKGICQCCGSELVAKCGTEAKRKGLSCGVPVPVCPEDIKKCNEEYLCTYGTTSMDTGLSWLNNSFADEAKIRGYMCGIISKPNIKKETCYSDAKLCETCYTDAKLCNDSLLCNNAVEVINGNPRWLTNPYFKEYVTEAKKRGLSCRVKDHQIPSKMTCTSSAKNCSNQLYLSLECLGAS